MKLFEIGDMVELDIEDEAAMDEEKRYGIFHQYNGAQVEVTDTVMFPDGSWWYYVSLTVRDYGNGLREAINEWVPEDQIVGVDSDED